MINGIGVLGWGVGGIEAEAGMLGQPSYFPIPEVIGVRLVNSLPQGATATDLALRVTQELRKKVLLVNLWSSLSRCTTFTTSRPCYNCKHGTRVWSNLRILPS